MSFRLLTALPSLLAAAAIVHAAPSTDESDFFEKHIRPILVGKCISCHGADEQESELRLDSRDAVLQGGVRGTSVDTTDFSNSRLLQAIRYDGDLQMPPAEKLSDREVALMTRWIELGTPWPKSVVQIGTASDVAESHWAFQPLTKPPMPTIGNANWTQNEIDSFVRAKLEEVSLTPSDSVDRRTFIRRAKFDLLGLPPTPDEVDIFVNDSSHDAVERLVDRLLASPQYGERWGRHWLDVARYADNKGYVFFEDKNYPWAYTYRDYVIRAFNADLPYDQFVREQIAADQLDLDNDKTPLAAMGFLTLGGHFMNNTHDIIDDRIDVVTRGLMGLTVTCARCHDHKFDPIPQADYYSLYGVFRSCYEPTVHPLFETPPQTEEYEKFAAELAKRESALVDFVTAKHHDLVTEARQRVDEYLLAAHARRGVPPADDFMLLVEKGDINPAMLLRWQRYLENPKRPHDSVWRPWRELSETQGKHFVQRLMQMIKDEGRAERKSPINSILRKRLAAAPPKSMAELADTYAKLLRDVNAKWLAVIQEAVDTGEPMPQHLNDPDAEELRATLYGSNAPADAPLQLDWGFLSLFPDRPTQGEYKELLKAVEEWTVKGDGAPPRAMVLLDGDTSYQPQIFQRGQPSRLGREVPRQFLSIATAQRQPFRNGSGRLELANAIVDPTNPLTARVIVNRVWQHHFGRALVTTPSDFGVRSDPPSHPKLLDYLAATLIQQGWSLKELHREIMTSATYRQASVDRIDGTNIDAENRLLWRMNRRRLDFESFRDSLLSVSNGLDSQMYGKSVDLFGADQSKPRRSIYGFINRMDVSPLLTTFDFPNPIASSAGRTSTTVPTQALYLMNNQFGAEVATNISREIILNGTDTSHLISVVYERLLARTPTNDEIAVAVEYLGSKPGAAAWERYIHGLLMTNEFVFVD